MASIFLESIRGDMDVDDHGFSSGRLQFPFRSRCMLEISRGSGVHFKLLLPTKLENDTMDILSRASRRVFSTICIKTQGGN